MKPLQLLQSKGITPPYNLGAEIGSGVDGQVFEIEGEKDQVIKFSFRLAPSEKEAWQIYNELDLTLDLINQSDKTKHFAKVIDSRLLFMSRPSPLTLEVSSVHYVVLEKLLPLSEDEVRLFHTLLSHEDAGKQKPASITALKKQIEELSQWLQFDKEKTTDFCFNASINPFPIRHLDLHPRNIMKDAGGNFKLVDLDRLERR